MLRDARHLVARSADSSGESLLTVTTAHRSESARRAAPLLLRDLPGLAGVTNSFDLPSANAIVGRHHRSLGGEAEIEETIGGVRYRVSAGSFFQVNVEMVARIFDYLEPYAQDAAAHRRPLLRRRNVRALLREAWVAGLRRRRERAGDCGGRRQRAAQRSRAASALSERQRSNGSASHRSCATR